MDKMYEILNRKKKKKNSKKKLRRGKTKLGRKIGINLKNWTNKKKENGRRKEGGRKILIRIYKEKGINKMP